MNPSTINDNLDARSHSILRDCWIQYQDDIKVLICDRIFSGDSEGAEAANRELLRTRDFDDFITLPQATRPRSVDVARLRSKVLESVGFPMATSEHQLTAA